MNTDDNSLKKLGDLKKAPTDEQEVRKVLEKGEKGFREKVAEFLKTRRKNK